MKRVITFMLMLAVVMLAFTSVCFASEVSGEKTSIEAYITDKIAPVVIGVLTAVVALVTTLGKIAKSLKALSDTKDTFESEARDRQTSLEGGKKLLEEKVQELKETVSDVPELKERVDMLIEECSAIAQILSLGFSSNKELVKSGKAHQMALLLENAECKMQKAKLQLTEATREAKTNEEA